MDLATVPCMLVPLVQAPVGQLRLPVAPAPNGPYVTTLGRLCACAAAPREESEELFVDWRKVQDPPEQPRRMEAAGAGTPPAQAPAPHPLVAPLAFLLGKWRGEGEGSFPTISSFRYGEELIFSHHPSKPVISYTQKTWKAASGEPMHAESGYWRPRPDGSVEVVIAQSTGLAEVQAEEAFRKCVEKRQRVPDAPGVPFTINVQASGKRSSEDPPQDGSSKDGNAGEPLKLDFPKEQPPKAGNEPSKDDLEAPLMNIAHREMVVYARRSPFDFVLDILSRYHADCILDDVVDSLFDEIATKVIAEEGDSLYQDPIAN